MPMQPRAPLYNMMVEVFWYQITSANLPFPTSRALTSLPAGNGALMNSGNAAYADPMYAGIYIISNGQSGGNARWIIQTAEEAVGKKFKAYVNFGNNWYVFEVQVWGPGTWTINNPGTGPALPNQIIFGEVVPIFEDFPPNERDPNHPPPTYNPFEPRIIIEALVVGPCSPIVQKVTLIPPANIAITQALVDRNGAPYGVSLTDLLAGYVFTQAGEYEMVIYYNFMGYPTETIVAFFTVLGEVYPYIQVERTYGGVLFPQSPVVFDRVLLGNGSIEYNTMNGQLQINACGVYFIKWFVALQAGFTADGANFAIGVGSAQGPQGSSHGQVSSVTGFAILEVSSIPYMAQLIHTSDGDIVLSSFTQATAGLVIVKIGDVEEGGETHPEATPI